MNMSDLKIAFVILFSAQISLPAAVMYTTDGASYVQDFTSLSTTTGSAQTWTDDTTLTGWYAYSSVAGSSPSSYTPQWQTGVSAGTFYHNRNTTDSGVSFFGARTTSGLGNATMGLQLTNGTGTTMNAFDLSFTASQFYRSIAAQELQVEVSTNATSLTTGTWTALPTLTFTAPYTTGNGTVSAADELSSRTLLSVSGESVSWVDGSDLWIRWTSFRDLGGSYSGASAVLGITDVSFSATAIPEPATVILVGLPLFLLGLQRIRRM